MNGIEFHFDDLMDKLDANYKRKENDTSKFSANCIHVSTIAGFQLRDVMLNQLTTLCCDDPHEFKTRLFSL